MATTAPAPRPGWEPERRWASSARRGLAAHPEVWSERDGAHLDGALLKAYEHVAEAIYLELAH